LITNSWGGNNESYWKVLAAAEIGESSMADDCCPSVSRPSCLVRSSPPPTQGILLEQVLARSFLLVPPGASHESPA
jgi:hypothetical protein